MRRTLVASMIPSPATAVPHINALALLGVIADVVRIAGKREGIRQSPGTFREDHAGAVRLRSP